MVAKYKHDNRPAFGDVGGVLLKYDIHPLYKAIILVIDRNETVFEREVGKWFAVKDGAQPQTVLLVRTGLEAGLSGPISFECLRSKSLPLDRSDLDGQPVIDIVRVSLSDAVRFILDLETREATARPESAHNCTIDTTICPSLPRNAGLGDNPITWADAMIEAAEKNGYDSEHETCMSIRRVQAALVGENFSELTPTPFENGWIE